MAKTKSTGKPLSPRELEVLEAAANGLTNDQTGIFLGMAPDTVRTHRQNVLNKLGVEKTHVAVAIALRNGWFK